MIDRKRKLKNRYYANNFFLKRLNETSENKKKTDYTTSEPSTSSTCLNIENVDY